MYGNLATSQFYKKIIELALSGYTFSDAFLLANINILENIFNYYYLSKPIEKDSKFYHPTQFLTDYSSYFSDPVQEYETNYSRQLPYKSSFIFQLTNADQKSALIFIINVFNAITARLLQHEELQNFKFYDFKNSNELTYHYSNQFDGLGFDETSRLPHYFQDMLFSYRFSIESFVINEKDPVNKAKTCLEIIHEIIDKSNNTSLFELLVWLQCTCGIIDGDTCALLGSNYSFCKLDIANYCRLNPNSHSKKLMTQLANQMGLPDLTNRYEAKQQNFLLKELIEKFSAIKSPELAIQLCNYAYKKYSDIPQAKSFYENIDPRNFNYNYLQDGMIKVTPKNYNPPKQEEIFNKTSDILHNKQLTDEWSIDECKEIINYYLSFINDTFLRIQNSEFFVCILCKPFRMLNF